MSRSMLVCVVLLNTWAVAAERPTAPPFVPSPVIEWGKPLEGGTIHALFVVQSAKQEGIEFLRRFDVTGEVLMSTKGGRYAVGTTTASLARRKLAAGNLDVFVLGGILWKRLPATLRLAVLERVRTGMGLLYVDPNVHAMDTTLPKLLAAEPAPDAPPAITSGVPLALLPLARFPRTTSQRNTYAGYPDTDHPTPTPDQLVAAARFGKGRIALLNYPVGESNVVYLFSLTPGVRRRDAPFLRPYPYWEYCHSLLGKAVRWCAGRCPSARLTVTPTAHKDGSPACVNLHASGAARPVDIEAVIRDKYHDVFARVRTTLAVTGKGDAAYQVRVAPDRMPPGGLCFVDVWARRDGKVVDWATAAWERPSGARITTVTLDRSRYAREQPVKVALAVAGAPAGAVIALRLVGTDGRVLQQQTHLARSPVRASFSLAGAHTLVSYLDARLMHDRRTLWRERRPVFLAPGPPRQFFAYSWMQGETYYTRDYLRRIQDQAVDAVLAAGGAASYFACGGRMAAEMNLRVVPTNVVSCRLSHLIDRNAKDTSKLARPLTDEKTMARGHRGLREFMPAVARLQPLGYSLSGVFT